MDNSQTLQNLQTKAEPHIQTQAEFRNDMMMVAINMRLKGFPYETIARRVREAGYHVTEGTVRGWFDISGACYPTYQKLRQERLQQLKEELAITQEKLQIAAISALAILEEGMLNDTITQRQKEIAQDILDRAGFTKTMKIDSNVKQESEGMNKVASALEDIAANIKK